jgi:hypothetical protein
MFDELRRGWLRQGNCRWFLTLHVMQHSTLLIWGAYYWYPSIDNLSVGKLRADDIWNYYENGIAINSSIIIRTDAEEDDRENRKIFENKMESLLLKRTTGYCITSGLKKRICSRRYFNNWFADGILASRRLSPKPISQHGTNRWGYKLLTSQIRIPENMSPYETLFIVSARKRTKDTDNFLLSR